MLIFYGYLINLEVVKIHFIFDHCEALHSLQQIKHFTEHNLLFIILYSYSKQILFHVFKKPIKLKTILN